MRLAAHTDARGSRDVYSRVLRVDLTRGVNVIRTFISTRASACIQRGEIYPHLPTIAYFIVKFSTPSVYRHFLAVSIPWAFALEVWLFIDSRHFPHRRADSCAVSRNARRKIDSREYDLGAVLLSTLFFFFFSRRKDFANLKKRKRVPDIESFIYIRGEIIGEGRRRLTTHFPSERPHVRGLRSRESAEEAK